VIQERHIHSAFADAVKDWEFTLLPAGISECDVLYRARTVLPLTYEFDVQQMLRSAHHIVDPGFSQFIARVRIAVRQHRRVSATSAWYPGPSYRPP